MHRLALMSLTTHSWSRWTIQWWIESRMLMNPSWINEWMEMKNLYVYSVLWHVLTPVLEFQLFFQNFSVVVIWSWSCVCVCACIDVVCFLAYRWQQCSVLAYMLILQHKSPMELFISASKLFKRYWTITKTKQKKTLLSVICVCLSTGLSKSVVFEILLQTQHLYVLSGIHIIRVI